MNTLLAVGMLAAAQAETPPADASGYGMKGVDYACAPCGELTAQMGVDVKATATSTLAGYPAANVIGSDRTKAWCEGEDGTGVGSKLKVAFGRPLVVHGVALWGGFFKRADLLAANGRVKTVRIRTESGVEETVRLADPTVALKTDPSTNRPIEGAWFDHVLHAEPPWYVLQDESGKPSGWVELEILEVYPGSKYTDTCVSGVDVMTIDPAELE